MRIRRKFRKRVYRKKKTGVKAIAVKALKIASRNRKAIETKCIDYSAQFGQGTTPTSGHLSIIQQGINHGQRIGNIVYCKGINLIGIGLVHYSLQPK